MNITEFLEARIAEDEKVASRSLRSPRLAAADYKQVNTGELLTRPDRVLAECAAKRAIIADHGWDYTDPYEGWKDDAYREIHGDSRDERTCTRCGGTNLVAGHGERGYKVAWPCPTIKALASTYKDHPDYPANGAA